MQWDLYCRVVDNFGDVGVAWRLAADLAGRGESVRLAVDDASALAWMAPEGASGVEVVGWHDGPSPAPDVVVELFGAGRPPTSWSAGAAAPVLVNLEHLSAEPYIERSHGLPSPSARPGATPIDVSHSSPRPKERRRSNQPGSRSRPPVASLKPGKKNQVVDGASPGRAEGEGRPCERSM